jgi:hypothetical protein
MVCLECFVSEVKYQVTLILLYFKIKIVFRINLMSECSTNNGVTRYGNGTGYAVVERTLQ